MNRRYWDIKLADNGFDVTYLFNELVGEDEPLDESKDIMAAVNVRNGSRNVLRAELRTKIKELK